MQITLSNAGKRYNKEWIFRGIDFSFISGKSYAIVGPNGSGKSTLLQTIAGAIHPSEGKCKWETRGGSNGISIINDELVYQHLAIAAPYLELIEEMTAKEFLHFHASFKPLQDDITVDKALQIIGLEKAANKQIRYYSSGMKQRVKLAQAVFSDVAVTLLDEPCTNLDLAGYELYEALIKKYCSHKLVIVSSNDVKEYGFCNERIDIMEYK
jgi:ABC-type multidrug transport system ATPase subunit